MHILITYNRKISVNNHFLGDHLLSTYVKFSEKKKYISYPLIPHVRLRWYLLSTVNNTLLDIRMVLRTL